MEREEVGAILMMHYVLFVFVSRKRTNTIELMAFV